MEKYNEIIQNKKMTKEEAISELEGYVMNNSNYDEEVAEAIEIVLAELKKYKNMYQKEYNEHMEMKRQNGVLRNNELILKRELEEKDKKIFALQARIDRLNNNFNEVMHNL